MSNDFSHFEACIKDILNNEIVSKIVGNKLEIREKNERGEEGRTGEFIEITNIKKSISLELDCSQRNIYFLSKNTKINDGTILYFDNNNLKVILLELKSKRKRNYKKQLLLGKAYIEFILSIVRIDKKINIADIEYRGFVFTTDIRGSRKKTTAKRGFVPDEVENGLKIKRLKNNSSYNLRELIM